MKTHLLFLLVLLPACSAPEPSSELIAPAGTEANAPVAGGGAASSSSGANGDEPSTSGASAIDCAGKKGTAGDVDVTIVSSGIERGATIHAPPNAGSRALPIVFVLHPLLLQRTAMRAIANVERFSDDPEHGFLAIFPDGIERSWNAGECCGEAKDRKIDDVRFIADLITKVKNDYCVDPTRIYSMGYSNGGFLSHRLACELEGGVRAIAPVAGTLGIPESSCKTTRAVPVLAIHGTEDELVPYEGGSPKIPFGATFGTFASPAATDAFWAKANGCGPAGAPHFTKGDVSCVRHDGCRDGASVGLCTVTGGGHQWPGGLPMPAMGHRTMNLDATAAAIDFFKQHGL